MCVSATMLEAGGAIAQGLSDNSTAKQQAKGLQMEGQSAAEAANNEANRIRLQGRSVEGTNRVALAASGVDMNSASALDIAAKNARDNELDAMMATYSGNMQKWSKDNEAKQVRYQGKMSLINGGIKAFAAVEKGVAKAAAGGAGGGG